MGFGLENCFFHVDITRHGSKNIGATNTFRLLGPVAGSLVMILDIGKGYLATWLPTFWDSRLVPVSVWSCCNFRSYLFNFFITLRVVRPLLPALGC